MTAQSGGEKNSTTVPAFVDTNVVVYAMGRDNDRKAKARQILEGTPIASSQVINETIAVLTGKQRFTREEVHEVAEALMKLAAVAPVTATTVRDAMTIGQRYGLSHWDALIVAAALHTGCDILFSEDMQHGQVFDGVSQSSIHSSDCVSYLTRATTRAVLPKVSRSSAAPDRGSQRRRG